MALISMTGFGAAEGTAPDGTQWRWELRSVNGRGLDLRFRLPDGLDAIEPGLRKRAQSVLHRGSITASLRLSTPETERDPLPDETALARLIASVKAVGAAAEAQGLSLAPTTADALLRMPGVMDRRPSPKPAGVAERNAALMAGFSAALEHLGESRANEGRALAIILAEMIDAVDQTVTKAGAVHAAWVEVAPARLKARLDALLDAAPTLDDGRLAQEVALLVVKLDVSEEVDRLRVHVESARNLLAETAPVGRRLDFLAQEFNREANTLCSKSDNAALTEAGLALKVLVDRLREQASNVE